MKKIALFCLASLLFLLCACQKENTSTTDIDLEALTKQITSAEGMPQGFTVADEDYIETAFEDLPAVENAKVLFADPDEGCAELGIFCLKSESDASKALLAVRSYLEDAVRSREATALLYPDESLTREIDQFKNATATKNGCIVYYLAMENAQAEAASNIIAEAIK